MISLWSLTAFLSMIRADLGAARAGQSPRVSPAGGCPWRRSPAGDLGIDARPGRGGGDRGVGFRPPWQAEAWTSRSWCSTIGPEDATAAIVREISSRRDGRARLVPGQELPPGWCGKQHACWILAQEARHPLLVFLDADVRLGPDALRRMAAMLEDCGLDLLSGFPRQETVGWFEKLLIPLMHFILLGFLPMERMRRSSDPAFAAGCGQLFLTRREAYDRAGGHSAIRGTLHDGLKLPRAYRVAGLKTDVCDANELVVCRMYRTSSAVWNGLTKNAGEALAAPRLILPMTVILLGGQVLPPFLVAAGLARFPGPWEPLAVVWASVGAWRRRIIPGGRPRSGSDSRGSGRCFIRSACSCSSRFSGTRSCGTWRGGPRPGRGVCTGPDRSSSRRDGSRPPHEPAGPFHTDHRQRADQPHPGAQARGMGAERRRRKVAHRRPTRLRQRGVRTAEAPADESRGRRQPRGWADHRAQSERIEPNRSGSRRTAHIPGPPGHGKRRGAVRAR